jgi:hypothetical protein
MRVFLAALVVCACQSPSRAIPTTAPAGSAARDVGVDSYAIARDERNAIDVELRGASSGHLTAQAVAGTVKETVTRDAHEITLVADGTSLRLGDKTIASRDADGWKFTTTLSPAEQGELALFAAVDQDLAVQGTSFARGEYVPCSLACYDAIACLPKSARLDGECARSFDRCVACLEVSGAERSEPRIVGGVGGAAPDREVAP